ncbi:hypothetical protein CVT25_002229 [Psilocybe cyanescens]|uniref:Uncharacterized protein n=1 Tax=Psilocybe cyanescens TaxID=93625 RepID=A0A409XF92_PSICY|nr:hypothetical protein CVT25_002229 [Psilocybe cyanescens]
MSEIDDIFASKAKHKDLPPPSPPSLLPFSKSSLKKAKKKKKRKSSAEDDPPQKDTDSSDPITASTSKKRPAPETVVDTSDRLTAPIKRHKGLLTKGEDKAPKPSKSDKKGLDEFKDSRGTGDRRTTEEGWLVYKEDELGIGDEGGGELQCVRHILLSIVTLYQRLRYVPLTAIVVFNIVTFYVSQYTQFIASPSRKHFPTRTALSKPLSSILTI